jgi:hypothetical protein
VTTDVQVTAGEASDACAPGDVPASYRVVAERVRRHLVACRGGAPFLSPDDSAVLVSWLDAGFPLHRILPAIEAAAERRRARRHRAPLALVHADGLVRGVGGAVGGARGAGRRPAPADHPRAAGTDPWNDALGRVVATLRALPAPLADVAQPAADAVERLASVGHHDRERVADDVLDGIAAFFEAAWPALGATGQARWRAAAGEALGDLAGQLDEAELDALVEEHARGLLRASMPALSATHLVQALLSSPL